MAVDSILLYNASFWFESNSTKALKYLNKVNRQMEIHTKCAYMTIRYGASFVLGKTSSIKLLAEKRFSVYSENEKEKMKIKILL